MRCLREKFRWRSGSIDFGGWRVKRGSVGIGRGTGSLGSCCSRAQEKNKIDALVESYLCAQDAQRWGTRKSRSSEAGKLRKDPQTGKLVGCRNCLTSRGI